MKNIILVLAMFCSFTMCNTKKASERSEDNVGEKEMKDVDKERGSYFDSFKEVSLPVKYGYAHITDLGGMVVPDMDMENEPFFEQYLAQDKINELLKDYFDKNYSEYPFNQFYEHGLDRVFKIGKLAINNPQSDFILLPIAHGDLDWYSEHMFLFEFGKGGGAKKLLGLISGECISRNPDDQMKDEYAYEIDGELSMDEQGNMQIKREIRHLDEEKGNVLETFHDSASIKINVE